jgi:hypothetical protein
MIMTNTFTTTHAFTRTSAQYLASKVVTDLRRLSFYYGRPTNTEIEQYYGELVELLVHGYLGSVEYGFNQNGTRVLSLLYNVRSDGAFTDARPGSVYARAQISGATWFSFLTYSQEWWNLSPADRAGFKIRLPIQRGDGYAPQDGNGYWVTDQSYTADGTSTQRRTFRPN